MMHRVMILIAVALLSACTTFDDYSVNSQTQEVVTNLSGNYQVTPQIQEISDELADAYRGDRAQIIVLSDQVKVTIPSDVLFGPGETHLSAASKHYLGAFAAVVKGQPNLLVLVEGLTDDSGSKQGNQKYSQVRADNVAVYLIDQGLPADEVTAIGYGDAHPVVVNDTPEDRSENRRIVLTVMQTPAIKPAESESVVELKPDS